MDDTSNRFLLPPSSLHPDDGDSTYFWNVGQCDFMAQRYRKQSSLAKNTFAKYERIEIMRKILVWLNASSLADRNETAVYN